MQLKHLSLKIFLKSAIFGIVMTIFRLIENFNFINTSRFFFYLIDNFLMWTIAFFLGTLFVDLVFKK